MQGIYFRLQQLSISLLLSLLTTHIRAAQLGPPSAIEMPWKRGLFTQGTSPNDKWAREGVYHVLLNNYLWTVKSILITIPHLGPFKKKKKLKILLQLLLFWLFGSKPADCTYSHTVHVECSHCGQNLSLSAILFLINSWQPAEWQTGLDQKLQSSSQLISAQMRPKGMYLYSDSAMILS